MYTVGAVHYISTLISLQGKHVVFVVVAFTKAPFAGAAFETDSMKNC